MLSGVELPEPGSHAETALLLVQKRKNSIERLRHSLLCKAIFMSGANPESFNKEVENYNNLQYALEKEINREIGAQTKNFMVAGKKALDRYKNKTVRDLLHTEDIKVNSGKLEDMDINTEREINWSKLNV